MNEKKRMPRFQLLTVACLGLALLGFNGAILVTPVAGANCTASCPGGKSCTCSGQKCEATDGQGCSGGTGVDQSVCSCNPS